MQNQLQYIQECEADFIARVDEAVAEILRRNAGLVTMGGPSSSGKTITCMVLTAKLAHMGRTAKIISTDDFFRNASESIAPDGKKDFDSINALDVPLLARTLSEMLQGQTVNLPKFDFLTGCRMSEYEIYTKTPTETVIIEGLHALNPVITSMLPEKNFLDIFICVDRPAVMPSGQILSCQDIRFLRRLIRDYKFRGASPEVTFTLWDNVIAGEDKYIMPYECDADIKIDSYLPYETSVVKHQAIDLLERVEQSSLYYPKAQELLQALRSQVSLPEDIVPSDSILREFLGGSSYYGK